MMTIDTNVFVYSVDDSAPDKQAAARTLIDRLSGRPCLVGLQVLGEMQNVLCRKLRLPPWQAAQAARNLLVSFGSFTATPTAVETALTQMAAGRMSYWDALLMAAAGEAGCKVMFSEDMQDGAAWTGVEVVNPFGSNGLSERALALLDL